MKITSVNNDLIKNTTKLQQRKYRDEEGLFLLEGAKCIDEAIKSGIELKYLFVEEGLDLFSEYERIEVTTSILAKISTTTTPPKTVAVGKQIRSTWNKNFKRIILLEDIKDYGNLGTIIRTSCAFDIDAIILYGDTVDIYNPKCVRASVGNLWKMPIFSIKTFEELKNLCNNYTPIATLPKNKNSIWLKDFKTPDKYIIMFGTESSGLSDNLIELAKTQGKLLTIEMSKNVESLNLSISAGVILYKLYNTEFENK